MLKREWDDEEQNEFIGKEKNYFIYFFSLSQEPSLYNEKSNESEW